MLLVVVRHTVNDLYLELQVRLQIGGGMNLDVDGVRFTRLETLPGNPKAHLEALPFLLQSLRDDLNDLAATAAAISGPPKARTETVSALPAQAGIQ